MLNAHRGFQNTMPYSPRTLPFMVDLLPKGSIFYVSGIGPAQLEAGVNPLLLGGQIARVGWRTIFTSGKARSPATPS